MEEITWTFFVLDFDDTFDNEEPDSLDCTPLVFMGPDNQIDMVEYFAYVTHDAFHEDMECDTSIGELFTNFLDENKIPYMVIGMIPLPFIKRSCNYLAEEIHTVSI